MSLPGKVRDASSNNIYMCRYFKVKKTMRYLVVTIRVQGSTCSTFKCKRDFYLAQNVSVR